MHKQMNDESERSTSLSMDEVHVVVEQMESSHERRRRRSSLLVVSEKESWDKTVHSQRLSQRLADRGIGKADYGLRFSDLNIREYSIMPGDNPGGNIGPPLTLQWTPHSEISVSLDEYEQARPDRRHGSELCIPAFDRTSMLQDEGYSRAEIQAYQKPVAIDRRLRRRSNSLTHLDGFMLMREKMTRKLANAATLGRRKREERKYLEPFVARAHHRPDHNRSKSDIRLSHGSDGTMDTVDTDIEAAGQ